MLKRIWNRLSFRRSGASTKPAGWSRPDWIIVGLGNPTPEYRETRHNAGFWCLEELARRSGARLKRFDPRVYGAETNLAGAPVVLGQPRTFMNLSGQAVGYLLRKYQAEPRMLIVIVDDMDILPGKIRVRSQGSAGGHNGLKSIAGTIGTSDFIRVRIGVGRPGSPGAEIDHVLSPLDRSDRALVNEAVGRAADAVEAILRDGPDRAMNTFN